MKNPETPIKALVTGGAGFIGSHLVDLLLAHGAEVIAIDNLATGHLKNIAHHGSNPRFRLLQADIRDLTSIQDAFAGVEWVFHLAGLADIVPSIERPLEYHQTNVDGTVAVLEAARMAEVKRFVYAASSSCYGIPDTVPTPETAEIRPQYPYALTKRLGEECVLHWSRVYGVPAVSLRLFNVYGPRSRTTGAYGAVFGVFLAQKANKKPFTIVGDGTQARDFTFVTDVASAFLLAAKSSFSGEIFNVGSSTPATINELARLLEGPAVYVPKRPGEPDLTHADTSKIRRLLAWAPQITLQQGVSEMLNRLQDWKSAPVWNPGSIEKATETWFKRLSGDRP